MMEVCIDSLLSGAERATGSVVIIDVFRAFTTAAVVLARGATKIIVVSDVQEALALRSAGVGQLCMGEVRGRAPVWPKYWNGGSACTSQGDRAYRSAELGRRVAKRLPRLPRSPNRIAQNRSSGIEPLGVRSRRLLMVIAQEPTQSLPALNRPRLVADIRITREQQDVTLALVIPLGMIMLNVFVQRPPQ